MTRLARREAQRVGFQGNSCAPVHDTAPGVLLIISNNTRTHSHTHTEYCRLSPTTHVHIHTHTHTEYCWLSPTTHVHIHTQSTVDFLQQHMYTFTHTHSGENWWGNWWANIPSVPGILTFLVAKWDYKYDQPVLRGSALQRGPGLCLNLEATGLSSVGLPHHCDCSRRLLPPWCKSITPWRLACYLVIFYALFFSTGTGCALNEVA